MTQPLIGISVFVHLAWTAATLVIRHSTLPSVFRSGLMNRCERTYAPTAHCQINKKQKLFIYFDYVR